MAISKTTARAAKKPSEKSHSVFETAPKAVLLMLFTGLFILLLTTAFALNLPSPAAFAKSLAIASLLIGAIVGGYFCAKRLEAPDSYAGAALAVVILILLLIITRAWFPFSLQSGGTAYTAIGYVIIALAAVAGVLLGSKGPAKRKRRKKHYRS